MVGSGACFLAGTPKSGHLNTGTRHHGGTGYLGWTGRPTCPTSCEAVSHSGTIKISHVFHSACYCFTLASPRLNQRLGTQPIIDSFPLHKSPAMQSRQHLGPSPQPSRDAGARPSLRLRHLSSSAFGSTETVTRRQRR